MFLKIAAGGRKGRSRERHEPKNLLRQKNELLAGETDTCPQKVSRKEIRSQPQLSQFIKQLDFKPFHKALPRGTQKEELYYPPEAMLKALILHLLLNLTYRELEQLLRRHTLYAKACGFMRGYIPDHTYYFKFITTIDLKVLEDIGVKIL